LRLIACLHLLALLGCVTAPPVTPAWSLPTDTADVCTSHCKSLGMDLGAVVIVRNSTGCVCQPRGTAPRASGGAAAATAGVVASLDEEAQQQQQQYRYQQEYWQQHTRTPTGAVNGLGGWHYR
jgi:hypothetical protein